MSTHSSLLPKALCLLPFDIVPPNLPIFVDTFDKIPPPGEEGEEEEEEAGYAEEEDEEERVGLKQREEGEKE